MADLVRWESGRDLMSLSEAMNRLFEESFLRPGWFGLGESAANLVPVDMFETDDHLVVKATVPGMKPEDIEVTVTGELLTIKGEFKQQEKEERQNYLRQERRFGSFCRQLTIPGGTEADKVKATFENGILTLELPKVEAKKAKAIKVVAK